MLSNNHYLSIVLMGIVASADATATDNSLVRAQALKAPRANAINDAEFVSIPFLVFAAIVFSIIFTNESLNFPLRAPPSIAYPNAFARVRRKRKTFGNVTDNFCVMPGASTHSWTDNCTPWTATSSAIS